MLLSQQALGYRINGLSSTLLLLDKQILAAIILPTLSSLERLLPTHLLEQKLMGGSFLLAIGARSPFLATAFSLL
ncbi:MAG: hypothetical protein VX893_07525 [Candidatus Latescibacterota bacterium]|nr:hypothetical protein [Candidatus Latescibacterota bacterium]